MPTNQGRLKAAIMGAKEALEEIDADAAFERYAEKLSAAIIVEIKAAQITYTSGLTSPSGAVSGTFTYTIT